MFLKFSNTFLANGCTFTGPMEPVNSYMQTRGQVSAPTCLTIELVRPIPTVVDTVASLSLVDAVAALATELTGEAQL